MDGHREGGSDGDVPSENNVVPGGEAGVGTAAVNGAWKKRRRSPCGCQAVVFKDRTDLRNVFKNQRFLNTSGPAKVRSCRRFLGRHAQHRLGRWVEHTDNYPRHRLINGWSKGTDDAAALFNYGYDLLWLKADRFGGYRRWWGTTCGEKQDSAEQFFHNLEHNR